MKKTILAAIIIVAASALSGCMTNATVPDLPDNMRLSSPDSYGSQLIDSITFSYPGKSSSGSRAAKCTAMHVSNESVVLRDSSGSFIGPYTGRFYNRGRSVSVSGGNVLQYSDKETGEVVADGRVEDIFTFGGIPIEKVVDFKVMVDASSGRSIHITFSHITSAHKETGVLTNSGFDRVGAWPGAKPVLVHNMLKKVADAVARCM